jgi:hypothetical protein
MAATQALTARQGLELNRLRWNSGLVELLLGWTK